MRYWSASSWSGAMLVSLFIAGFYCSGVVESCYRTECPRCWFIMDQLNYVEGLGMSALELL